MNVKTCLGEVNPVSRLFNLYIYYHILKKVMFIIGIYKYTNKINGCIYIGQSVNIEQRKYCHRSSAYNKKANDYNSQFHQAIRKYGYDNFDFEIVAELTQEEVSKQLLNELEIYFISYYNSYKQGYNATPGGDGKGKDGSRGSLNGRALLTEEDVIYIRECYNAHIPFKKVYEEYKAKISKRGFQNVWWFKTWQHIFPEYHTEENKYWHSHQAKANPPEIARQNQRTFSREEILAMRQDYAQGMTPKQIWLKYAPNRAWSTVYNAITKQTYKDI